MMLWFYQAHAKVWHSYDMQWRGKQKGKQGRGGGSHVDSCLWVLTVIVDVCRFSWNLSGGRLGRASGHQQPERHWSSREIRPVLPRLVRHLHLSRRLPPSDERLHRYHKTDHPVVQRGNFSWLSLHAGRKSVQQGLSTSRLPTFSPQEKSYIKGTCDFLGISHYTTRYITQRNNPSSGSSSSYFTDRDLAELVDPRWPDPGSEWLYSVPWGFRRLLNFVKVVQTFWYFVLWSHTCIPDRLFDLSYSLSTETRWFTWLRMESLRRWRAQSCVMIGGYTITKTTLTRCWKVN